MHSPEILERAVDEWQPYSKILQEIIQSVRRRPTLYQMKQVAQIILDHRMTEDARYAMNSSPQVLEMHNAMYNSVAHYVPDELHVGLLRNMVKWAFFEETGKDYTGWILHALPPNLLQRARRTKMELMKRLDTSASLSSIRNAQKPKLH